MKISLIFLILFFAYAVDAFFLRDDNEKSESDLGGEVGLSDSLGGGMGGGLGGGSSNSNYNNFYLLNKNFY